MKLYLSLPTTRAVARFKPAGNFPCEGESREWETSALTLSYPSVTALQQYSWGRAGALTQFYAAFYSDEVEVKRSRIKEALRHSVLRL